MSKRRSVLRDGQIDFGEVPTTNSNYRLRVFASQLWLDTIPNVYLNNGCQYPSLTPGMARRYAKKILRAADACDRFIEKRKASRRR